ncbi:50S ribosomal protein L11 methyltransferase [Alicyclobacillus shizuokensis]|uniref:50S ribosomal protein L11 methyltransferase n=1 Tax=Alicyclobacillus shizuokensis TaxID=392014 RepID=UPI00082E5536|nr:50S ribosomal protein L11 methyltransferase [Alicyclobacillus shizuokensis]MCL6627030.1 50S ribosomal protein L11 methyltransferase [Alicyclobacillus shizuokensis]
MKKVRWWQLNVRVPSESAEALAALLQEWPEVGGVAMEGDVATAPGHPEWGEWFDDSLLTKARFTHIQVYVPELTREQEIRRRAEEALTKVEQGGLDIAGARASVGLRLVDESEWDNVWKQDFEPLSVGRRLRIVPRWQADADTQEHLGRIALRLEPGMAFGTGMHETTQLCLEALEDFVRADSRVLDIGCGTAILAIAAAKLGAREATAIDIDPVAVDVARENVRDNRVDDRVQVRQGDLLTAVAESGFDLAVANILRDIIVRLAPQAAAKLRPGGVFISSGFVHEQTPPIEDALTRAGMRIVERRSRGDWLALVAVNER